MLGQGPSQWAVSAAGTVDRIRGRGPGPLTWAVDRDRLQGPLAGAGAVDRNRSTPPQPSRPMGWRKEFLQLSPN